MNIRKNHNNIDLEVNYLVVYVYNYFESNQDNLLASYNSYNSSCLLNLYSGFKLWFTLVSTDLEVVNLRVLNSCSYNTE